MRLQSPAGGQATRTNMRFYIALPLLIGLAICVRHVTATLVIASGGVYKVIIGWSIPVDLPMTMSINYAHNFQFQYNTVDNASMVSYVQQGARAIHLQQTRSVLTRAGLDRHCMLRAICETAGSPFDHSGLIGELLQVILTPQMNDSLVNDYSVAWRSGLEGKDCLQHYQLCPYGHSALDHLSYYM